LIPLLLGIAIIIVLICAGRLSFSREWFAVGRVLGNSLGMRREIQYALALTRWLTLEGDRCMTVEELWSNLVFAAQRLGFNYVRLTLAGEQRAWGQSNDREPNHSARHELQAGRFGTLELKARACDWGYTDPAPPVSRASCCARPCCPCVSEEKVFGIVSELLAEGWTKAATRWSAGEQSPLRFDTRITRPRNYWQDRLARTDAAPRVSDQNGKGVNPPLKDAAR
jgi:hypothetical protein